MSLLTPTPGYILFQAGVPYSNMIGNVLVDIFETETYANTSKATEYPIESGSTISDHIVNQPFEFDVKGFIGCDNNWQLAKEQLDGLFSARQLITLTTTYAIYLNMHIESYTINRSKDVGQGLDFSMHLKQLTLIQSQAVGTPNGQIINSQNDQIENLGKTASGASVPTAVVNALAALTFSALGL